MKKWAEVSSLPKEKRQQWIDDNMYINPFVLNKDGKVVDTMLSEKIEYIQKEMLLGNIADYSFDYLFYGFLCDDLSHEQKACFAFLLGAHCIDNKVLFSSIQDRCCDSENLFLYSSIKNRYELHKKSREKRWNLEFTSCLFGSETPLFEARFDENDHRIYDEDYWGKLDVKIYFDINIEGMYFKRQLTFDLTKTREETFVYVH